MDQKISSDPTTTLALGTIFPVVSPTLANEQTTLAAIKASFEFGGVAQLLPADRIVDVRRFGNLFAGGDVSAIIQAALDYAATISGAAVMPPGTFQAANLLVSSFTQFLGSGMGTKIQAPAGATGTVVGLKSVNVQRCLIANLWLDGNGQTLNGVTINNDGGSWAPQADPENRLAEVLVTNCALDGFHFVGSRVLQVLRCRARACTQDNFSCLPGATDSVTDSLFIGCTSSAAGRDGLHIETGSCSYIGWKIGEAGRYGCYLKATALSNNLSGLVIDNTGFPSFTPAASTPLRVEGYSNHLTNITVTRGVGQAVVFASTAADNVFSGTAGNYQGNGSANPLTFGVLLAAGATGNDVQLNLQRTNAGAIAVPVTIDPASDIDANRVVVDGCDTSVFVEVERFRAVAGTPSESTTGGRIPMWSFTANADQVGCTFQVPRIWRGHQVRLTLIYNCNVGDNTKNIQFGIGLASLSTASPVTEVDLSFQATVAAPAAASTVTQTIFSTNPGQVLTIGAGDVEGSLTILRDAGTTLAGGTNIVLHKALLRAIN